MADRWIELEFPTLRQFSDWDCGDESALAPVLLYYGIPIREDRLIRRARSTRRGGTNTGGILRVLRYYGLEYRAGRQTVGTIRAAIDRREPVILTLQAYGDPADYVKNDGNGHYVTAIGYRGERIKFHDSAAYCHTFLSVQELLDRWHDADAGGKKIRNWGCIVRGTPAFRRNRIAHMD